jgi:ribonuclease HII
VKTRIPKQASSPLPKPRKTSASARSRKVSKLSALLRFDARLLKELNAECHLIGLDEVGRGSLIGSVVGGAACLPKSLTKEQKRLLNWLDDSKKLSAPVREELAQAIRSFCYTGIGQAEKHEVDELNIHYASLLAVYRALEDLCAQVGLTPGEDVLFLMMDGRAVIPDYRQDRQRAIIKGDGCSAAIAAASVIAKQHRDSMIKTLALDYPGYGWEVNMGYPTPAHIQGIRQLGITPLHRKNFRKAHEQLVLPLG